MLKFYPDRNVSSMIDQDTKVQAKYVYLLVAEAIQKTCDEELVYEMLVMLNSSIEKDWAEFVDCFNLKQFTAAANILHGMKGAIPIFSDKKTEVVLQKTESLLRSATANEFELQKATEELRVQLHGFIAELKHWVQLQNSLST